MYIDNNDKVFVLNIVLLNSRYSPAHIPPTPPPLSFSQYFPSPLAPYISASSKMKGGYAG
jgi:hypothetical protein